MANRVKKLKRKLCSVIKYLLIFFLLIYSANPLSFLPLYAQTLPTCNGKIIDCGSSKAFCTSNYSGTAECLYVENEGFKPGCNTGIAFYPNEAICLSSSSSSSSTSSSSSSSSTGGIILTNLVLNLDASNLDGAGTFATKNTTNTTWFDLSLNGNNGTLNNFKLPSNATSGWDGENMVQNPSVLKFDGVNDYVTVNHSPNLNVSSSITVSVWTKNDDLPRQYDSILMKTTKASWTDGYGFYYNGISTIRFFVSDWLFNAATAEYINALEWNNFVGTYDGNSVKIYVNGVLSGTQTFTGDFKSTNANLDIGRSISNSFNIDGIIANVRIYDKALTTEQVIQNYQAEVSKFEENSSGGDGGGLGTDQFLQVEIKRIYTKKKGKLIILKLRGDNLKAALENNNSLKISLTIPQNNLTTDAIESKFSKSGKTMRIKFKLSEKIKGKTNAILNITTTRFQVSKTFTIKAN